ncbi:hydantoinase/oxoprolinase family protein [Candidatus Margulisiibacteriota bacterium]
MPKIRIGVDVGGTFTHAVAIGDPDLKLVGQAKVQTTHRDRLGVARGVVDSLKVLLKRSKISAKDVSLVAHSTTQATNALLEGDVSTVGVISLGSGFSGFFVQMAANISGIKLLSNKKINVISKFYDIGRGIRYSRVRDMILELKELGARVLVIAEAFSTEDSENEKRIAEVACKLGVPCTATSDISGLYGLRARTKTAIVNACILPRMIDAAEKTEKAIRSLKITAPIMVVRSDGGVLSLEEMRKRPILTILSGPAAGVGAALFHEKISNGVFIEVGGTSTDISLIRNGVSQIRPAVLGEHRLYLKTLDVRTLGVAGGSLPRIDKNELADVGPRSAHIAGISYASFSKPKSFNKLKVKFIQPQPGDINGYLSFSDGRNLYSVTPTCAANYLGFVRSSDWAYGNQSSVKRMFDHAGKTVGTSGKHLALAMLDIASGKLEKAVRDLAGGYGLEPGGLKLIGGGGGAAALVPYLGKKMGLKYKLAKDQAVISAIGAALSMVHEEVERSVPYPKESDIVRVKLEAQNKVISMGALPGTVHVNIDVDIRKGVIRASAFGSLKMEKKKGRRLNTRQLKDMLVREIKTKHKDLVLCGDTGKFSVFQELRRRPLLFFTRKEKWLHIVEAEGCIRHSIGNASSKMCTIASIQTDLRRIIESSKKYGDAGAIFPQIMIVFRDRITDLSSLSDITLMEALLNSETAGKKNNEKVAIIWKLR